MSDKMPSWFSKAVITALVGILLSGAFGWASTTSMKDTQQDKDIAVVQENQRNIEVSLKRIEEKLDRVLEK